MTDRRVSKRIHMRLNVTILDPYGQFIATGTVFNMCEDGLCFGSDKELRSTGNNVFECRMDNCTKPLRLIAAIVWKNTIGQEYFLYGVAFEKKDIRTKIEVRTYLYPYYKFSQPA